MSLQVWLPLNGDLRNQGISNIIGTNYNSTVNTAGKIGSCYYFNGSNMRIEYPHDKTIWSDKEISICMWYKWATGGNESGQCVIDIAADLCLSYKHSSSGIQFGYWRAYSNNGTRTGNGDYASTYYTDTTWHHVVLICDHNFNHIYVDGVLSQTFDKSNNYTTNWKPLLAANYNKITIGKSAGSNPYASGYVNDVRIYDHALSAAEVKEISQGLVLHYPLNRNSLKPIGTNLVTGVTKGGQTTLLTDGRVGVVTSGTSADTYFTVNLSESITNGTTYYLSCDVSGVSDGQYWGFPLGAQSNTSMPSKFYNGHNEYIFTANDINWGTNRLFLDDNYRNDYAHPASFYNFVLIKNPTFEEVDGSGFGHNSTSNAPITTSEDTGRYEEASYFGAYNTPVLTVNNFSAIAPALTSCTITWWGKYDTTKTLLFTGHTTSYYLAASNNNTYYHGNGGTITFYKDGIAGTYKCAADGWHHFAMTGVNLSSWTALKLNGYSSSWPLNGYISDLRIYNTILSADDILQLYHTSAKVDNLGDFHTFELSETNNGRELLAVPLTTSYSNRTNIYTNYDANGEITLTGSSSIGSNYIKISPTGNTYYYDFEVSIDANNQIYIGFERFDAAKTSRSNSACIYAIAPKPPTALSHAHYHGTINIGTPFDANTPVDTIAVRILNDWSGAAGRSMTVHKMSLREVSTLQNTKINKQGQTITIELIEMNDKFRVQKNGIIETSEIIEL